MEQSFLKPPASPLLGDDPSSNSLALTSKPNVTAHGCDSGRGFEVRSVTQLAAPRGHSTAREPRRVDSLLDRPFNLRCPNGRFRPRTILSSPRCGSRAWD